MATRSRRRSVFYESGLFDGNEAAASTSTLSSLALSSVQGSRDSLVHEQQQQQQRPQVVRFRSRDEVHFVDSNNSHNDVSATRSRPSSSSKSTITTRSAIQQSSSSGIRRSASPRLKVNESPLPENSRAMMYRLGGAFLFLAAAVPLLQSNWWARQAPAIIQGVSGEESLQGAGAESIVVLDAREDTQTSTCFRWAQQSTIVNGTMYLYGGQAMTDPTQTENTWNNNFLTLDLTESWQIDSPSMTGLPQPSGAPAVAEGYLWSSYDSLFLYGGEFSWKPPVEPSPFALWQYQIHDQSWTEHNDPITSSGKNAPSNGVPVQRAAEGAGANVPSLGRGFYFGGHEDGYTTDGWSQSVPRVYLQSLLEYTFPGYSNNQVTSANTEGSSAGSYRNITVGGLQASAGFTARADGLLVYIPDFGSQGILLALAGGTNQTYTQMNEINIYDIASSSWYTQSTSGPTPKIRVSPCAVVAAAPDGSSFNIYMFGGENLIPFGDQTQFDDMWILTVPAFTWIKVDQSGQSVPYGRSGASCQMWDAQMVVVGGYLGDSSLSCEYPGVYVFDLSKLEWVQEFNALSPGKSSSSDSAAVLKPQPVGFESNGSSNPFNQQPAQIPDGLQGSYGYTVPQVVVSVIGGDVNGGATITRPIVTATGGPLQTGTAQTYTVTNSAGSVVTKTASAQPGSSTGSSGGSSSSPGHKSDRGSTNIAAIVVGVVCGLLLVTTAYLLFCLYLYRKQVRLYKRHLELSQRRVAAGHSQNAAFPSLWGNESDVWESTAYRSGAGEGKAFLHQTESGSGSDGRQPGSISVGEASSDPSAGRKGYAALSGAEEGISGGAGGIGVTGGGVGRSSWESSTEDLIRGREPTFVGVMLNPRRSLRVINRD